MTNVRAGLTTSQLLKSIKRRAMVPDNQSTFSDQDLIDFMNEEMMIGLVPTVLQMKHEYLIFKQIVSIVGNKSNYVVPERALGSKLREVCYQDNVGNEYEMSQIAVDDRYDYLANVVEISAFRRFYMSGSDLMLFPSVGANATGNLAFYYYIRPNTLVKDNEIATISNIDRTTGNITLSNIPTAFNVQQQYDFIRAKSPHNILSIDKSITALNTSTKVLTVNPSDIPYDLIVGDHIGIASQSCIPNIPTELHSMLAQRVAQRIMEAIGDTQGLANATAKLQEMEQKTGSLLDSRCEGAPRKVVSRALLTGLGRVNRGRVRFKS
jgi:hypothetical protein